MTLILHYVILGVQLLQALKCFICNGPLDAESVQMEPRSIWSHLYTLRGPVVRQPGLSLLSASGTIIVWTFCVSMAKI